MKITKIYIYPIKSLRPISLHTANLCPQGLEHDRRYILLRPAQDGGYSALFVGNQAEMALFHCKLSSRTTFTVEYHIPTPPIAPPTLSQKTKLHIPFEPDSASLKRIDIDLHTISTYPAFLMSDEINTWFSQCFGYEVVLAYTGDALGIKKGDDLEQSWLSSMQAIIPKQIGAVRFSDGAALLIASDASLEDVHTRLPHGEESVLEKFRPNIVVDGEGKAWDEDFWAELTILPLGAKLMVIANCARCTSINVDLEKGRMAEGESGKLLKKLMKDRRIDLGDKWSPIFGRYAFPLMGGEIAIGDEVIVTKRNDEHTVWSTGILPRLANFEPRSGTTV